MRAYASYPLGTMKPTVVGGPVAWSRRSSSQSVGSTSCSIRRGGGGGAPNDFMQRSLAMRKHVEEQHCGARPRSAGVVGRGGVGVNRRCSEGCDVAGRSLADLLHDAVVAGAATEIARQADLDLVLGRVGV